MQVIAKDFGPQLQTTMQQVTAIANNLEKASSQLGAVVEDNRRDLRSFTRDSLPEVERLLRDGRDAAAQVRELARSLKQNPSQLLYQAPPSGMEIAR
jgi:phospholipid/cholesterol/gamma-HCH transport system substrate-binding protein